MGWRMKYWKGENADSWGSFVVVVELLEGCIGWRSKVCRVRGENGFLIIMDDILVFRTF